MPHKSHHTHNTKRTEQKEHDRADAAGASNVEQNPGAPRDFAKVGPRSIEGVEASDLPDKGRGSVDTEIGHEMGRKLPQQTGAIEDGTDVGLRATPDVADAADNGHRGKN